MSLKHQKRIEGVIDDSLKQAALGEPYGFFVAFTFGPPPGPDGAPRRDVPPEPGWMVAVSIRDSNPGQPDVMNGFFCPGVMPPDEMFRAVSNGLLMRNRKDRDEKQNSELAAARAAFQQQMKGAA